MNLDQANSPIGSSGSNLDGANSPIVYSGPFRENVQGVLKARFQLDSAGEPIYEPYPQERRLRVYTMDLYLETPRAREIKGVRYYLDDPAYPDPEGYADEADNGFRLEIVGYGDFEILVTVEMAERKFEQRALLSTMLENGHAQDMTEAIRMAILRIKLN